MANRPALIGDRPPAYPSKATLAAELDISESTVDAWVKLDLLPQPIRRGGSVRWCWAEVVARMTPPESGGADHFMTGLDNV